ncbi:hypothetical protein D9757_002944 [Collybiopsis confluens]|uniref:Uncharacterized protein n=1 Tax=Collybiopsis confluens TaxID=2823264 RepID=A0A8H5HVI7_9AGAR|nr:hypothetical protein D9757_002944 [Collybiopsis confluens]
MQHVLLSSARVMSSMNIYHKQTDNRNTAGRESTFRLFVRLWLLGLAIFISSNVIGSLVQIASLPVVILAPLGAVSLLWNAFFARLILGDSFSSWMIVATLFIAGGAVLIAVFGIVPEPTRSLEDLLALFRRPTFVVYFSLLGAIVFLSLAMTHLTEYRLNRRCGQTISLSESPTNIIPPVALEPPSTLTTGITDSVTDAIINERAPLLDYKSQGSSSRASSLLSLNKFATQSQIRSFYRTRLMIAISYASFSGIISGMCLLFAKSGVELLLLTVQGQNQFWRWQSWVLVISLIVFALLQLWYLHKGLTLADPTLVCPSAFCFYNLSSIVNGLVYFDQFNLISPLHLGLVALGIVVLLVGVWVVSIQAGGEGTLDVPWVPDNVLNDEASAVEDEPVAIPEEIEARASANHNESHSLSAPWGTASEPVMGSEQSSRSHFGEGLSPSSVTSQPFYSSDRASPSNIYSSAHLRRPTAVIDTRHHRTQSNSQYHTLNHNSLTRPPLSPTLPTVSTLAGTGFQIGLSPFSPGFSVVPLERRRRIGTNFSSGLPPSSSAGNAGTIGGGTRYTDYRSRVADGERRRTVSEGDVNQHIASSVRVRHEGQVDDSSPALPDQVNNEASTGKGKSKGRNLQTRRSWWRTFTRR